MATATSPSATDSTLPPLNNMGGKSPPFTIVDPDDPSQDYVFYVVPDSGSRSKWKRIKVPRPDCTVNPESAFIDQVSFTAPTKNVTRFYLTDEDFARAISPHLEEIFGFGVTAQRDKALNFYASTYILGDYWGQLSIGGKSQNDTFLVQLYGQGSAAAKPGWEKRLHDRLQLPGDDYPDGWGGKITRADVAKDDYEGKTYTPQQCRQDFLDGKFNNGGRTPHPEPHGPWDAPEKGGLTYCIGKRDSGKLLRVYEKGKQLGGIFVEQFADWVRTELELHNEDRVIPLDILINPGQYLAGAYPALAWVNDQVSRIKTKCNAAKISVERAQRIVKQQCGAYLYAFKELLGSADAAFAVLMRDKVPKRLTVPHWEQSPPPLPPPELLSLDEALNRSWGYA